MSSCDQNASLSAGHEYPVGPCAPLNDGSAFCACGRADFVGRVYLGQQPARGGRLDFTALGQAGAPDLVCNARWLAGAGFGASRVAMGAGGTLLLAGWDEWHQFDLPGRSPGIDDWLADALGVLAGVAVVWVMGMPRKCSCLK